MPASAGVKYSVPQIARAVRMLMLNCFKITSPVVMGFAPADACCTALYLDENPCTPVPPLSRYVG
jgi:hypothetical protein